MSETSGAATSEPAEESSRPAERFVDFVTANLVFAVSLAGAFAYVVTRLGQTSFYSKFGLEPEDVGLDYAGTLTRAAAGLAVLLLLVGALVVKAFKGRWWDPEHRAPAEVSPRSELLGRAVAVVFVALAICAVWLPVAYLFGASSVRDGNAMRPAGLSTPWRIATNPLGLRVEPVHVTWIGETAPSYEFGDKAVMYLGRANGTAAFFDPCEHVTVRVPDGDLVITRAQKDPSESCPDA